MTSDNKEGFSLSRILFVYEQLGRDLVAFHEAKICVQIRVDDAAQVGWQLDKWVGADATLGSLLLAIEHLERRREYYGDLINKLQSGELHNTDTAEEAAEALSVSTGGMS